MGTDFVPRTPEVTALRMAGPKALAELARALGLAAQGQGQGQGQGAGNGLGQAQGDGQGKPGGAGAGTGAIGSIGGRSARNQAVKEGELESVNPADPYDSRTPSGGPRDPKAAGRQFREETWFLKLPPDLRQAIRAESQRRAPPGYEDRLRRYFESID
jgi:hypothetical protein